MITRDDNYYDLFGSALGRLGYTGAGAFNAFINDAMAEKWNGEQVFEQMGFPLNPNIPLNPTFEQIEATVRPYTMATYVDIDSDGPVKSPSGIELKTGGLPTFKHEVVTDRKILREKLLLAQMVGGTTPDMDETVLRVLFTNADYLIGGNYNTMRFQRHQIVSNEGKLVINASNNPLGIPLEIDFGVPKKNIKTSTWYTKTDDGTVTQDTNVGKKTDPIKDMRMTRVNARNKDFAPAGHWEVSRTTWEDIIALPYFRQMYAAFYRPDISDDTQQVAYGNLVSDEDMKRFIESRIGAPIVVIDMVSSIEKLDPKTKKLGFVDIESFNEGVMVYVPDGALGDTQCGRPVYMETPGSRVALYDGGRTLIRQVFNDETMTNVVKSEVTALCVPNKTRWFYYLHVKGD